MLLRAMHDMHVIVRRSYLAGDTLTRIPRRPFLLDPTCAKLPSSFDVEVVVQGVRWQYGFAVDDERVRSEQVRYFPRGRPVLLYRRRDSEIEYGPSFRAADRWWDWLLRDNALLLSVAGFAGDDQLLPLYRWFHDNCWLATASSRRRRIVDTARALKSPERKQRILDMIRYADLGVADVRAVVESIGERPDRDTDMDYSEVDDLGGPAAETQRVVGLRLTHEAYVKSTDDDILDEDRGESGEPKRSSPHRYLAELEFDDESLGTQIWVGLARAILDALDEGRVLLLDELDASLHPNIVERLVGMFQDPRTNPRGAQLIFNTHDSNILGDNERRLLGRDQVWFTEKGPEDASSLYSLADFDPTPRRDDAIERRYLTGRYGAIPSPNPADLASALPIGDAEQATELANA